MKKNINGTVTENEAINDESFRSEYIEKRKTFRFRTYLFVKRTFDIFFSGLFLLVFSWFILFVLLIKWLEDFANPVYVSKRVGKDGKIFNFYKIRSMIPKAEALKKDLIEKGLNEADGPAFKIKNDPRITPFGKFIRKFSIDEFLQMWNVLKGDMSIVGPRPPIPSEVEQYSEKDKLRLLSTGGLLCFWQISKNRNGLTFEEWVNLDIEYLKKQSLLTDLKIIFKGFWMVLFDHSGE